MRLWCSSQMVCGTLCLALLSACAHRKGGDRGTFPEAGLISKEIKQEVQRISDSVVGIITDVTYEIHTYNYLTQNGEFVPDPNSPVHYRLDDVSGDSGVFVHEANQSISGGGLIIKIDRERSLYAILTSNHLVAPRDTTEVYYLDEEGVQSDVIFARRIVKGVRVSVHGESPWRAEAEIVAEDTRLDLALITAQTTKLLGREFPNEMGYDLELGWGDWVFLFGYPKSIKQLSGGWVSASPYPNTLAVDAVAREGYSGGPVFAVVHDPTRLVCVGLIKSVPFRILNYVKLTRPAPAGHQLSGADLGHLVTANKKLVDYGTAYFVSPEAIGEFFLAHRQKIGDGRIQLNPKYFPAK